MSVKIFSRYSHSPESHQWTVNVSEWHHHIQSICVAKYSSSWTSTTPSLVWSQVIVFEIVQLYKYKYNYKKDTSANTLAVGPSHLWLWPGAKKWRELPPLFITNTNTKIHIQKYKYKYNCKYSSSIPSLAGGKEVARASVPSLFPSHSYYPFATTNIISFINRDTRRQTNKQTKAIAQSYPISLALTPPTTIIS